MEKLPNLNKWTFFIVFSGGDGLAEDKSYGCQKDKRAAQPYCKFLIFSLKTTETFPESCVTLCKTKFSNVNISVTLEK